MERLNLAQLVADAANDGAFTIRPLTLPWGNQDNVYIGIEGTRFDVYNELQERIIGSPETYVDEEAEWDDDEAKIALMGIRDLAYAFSNEARDDQIAGDPWTLLMSMKWDEFTEETGYEE